jgi:hypothetical protein
MSGASAGDHHESPPGLDQKSVTVGHEPDRFGIGGIVAVPIAVVLTLVLAYVVVTLMFSYVNGNTSDPIASGDVPINDRLGRISSAGGVVPPQLAGKQQPSGAPRLDGLPTMDFRVNGKDVAPYLMSFRRTPTGNWPDIYPEDLRAERYVDYATQTMPLADPPAAVAGNADYARIPIQQAIALLTGNDELNKRYVPATDKPLSLPAPAAKVKESNGGQKKK